MRGRGHECGQAAVQFLLKTLKVTVDMYGKRKWAAGGGGPGDLFN